MKIAVTCSDNSVFQHFGHTPEFAVFEIEGERIASEKRLSCGDSGHGALASLLTDEKIEVLVCGGIGPGAVNALAKAGIEVIGGAEGNVRSVVEALLAGTLEVRTDYHCNHHHGSHSGDDCKSHSCGGSCSC